MLSAYQKQLVQYSFKKVAPIADDAAAIFYAKLFEYDPKLKALFKSDLRSQGKKLMMTLGIAVKGLDNLDELVPVLEQLARKHIDYSVSVDDYTPVGNALLYTLKTGLGDDFTPECRKAWVITFKAIADVMRTAAYPSFDPATYKNVKYYHK